MLMGTHSTSHAIIGKTGVNCPQGPQHTTRGGATFCAETRWWLCHYRRNQNVHPGWVVTHSSQTLVILSHFFLSPTVQVSQHEMPAPTLPQPMGQFVRKFQDWTPPAVEHT